MGKVFHVTVERLTLDVYEEAVRKITIHCNGELRAPFPSPIGSSRWATRITVEELQNAWARLQKFIALYPDGVFQWQSCESRGRWSSLHSLMPRN
mmetsp:Transcript_33071/g.68263  ORF Transcript_33071/g.68263 Transcript_33071/m.68263 type:complete len:95 (+) Transcript_33071:1-285(+)